MAKPVTSRSLTLLPTATVANNGWTASSGILQNIVAGTETPGRYVYSQYGISDTLIFTYGIYTPAGNEHIYGLLVELRGVCCTLGYTLDKFKHLYPYVDFQLKITCAQGTKNFTVPMRDIVDVVYPGFSAVVHGAAPESTELGDDRHVFIYAFDKKIREWDLSSVQVTLYTPIKPQLASSMIGIVKSIKLYGLYFIPPSYTAEAQLPPHVWDASGLPSSVPGGYSKPAVSVSFFDPATKTDIPDVVRVIHTDRALAPQGTLIQDFGIITPRPSDNGIIVPKVDLVNPDTPARPTGYIHTKCGWLVPATGEYYWTNWSSFHGRAIATRPVAPVLTTVINGDQVDMTGFSCDNLLSPWYTGFRADIIPDPNTHEHPNVIANNTLVSQPAYDTVNQRGDWCFRVTRITSIGAIELLSTLVPVQVGKTYAASCFFRTSVGSSTTLNIQWLNAAGGVISTSVVDTDNQTVRTLMQGTAVAPALAVSAQIRVIVASIAIGATLDVDSISLSRYNGASIPQYNTGGHIWGNAATRLGSEKAMQGNTHFWMEEETPNIGTVTDVTTAPRTGTHHIQYVTSGSSTLVLPLHRHYLPEAIPPGVVVSARAWVRPTTLAHQCTLGLRFVDTEGDLISEFWGPNAATVVGVYTKFMAEGAVVPVGTAAIFLLVGLPENVAQTFYIDDIGVFYTPTCPADTQDAGGYVIEAPHAGCLGFYVIERQLANDTTWTPISIQQVNPLVDVAFTDYLVPEGMTFRYRARVLGTMDGRLVEGAYTAEETETTASPGLQWTLWDPSSDTKGPLRFDLSASNPMVNETLISALAMYAPVGRNRRVLTKDVSKGRVFALDIDLIDGTQLALWETYHEDRNVLILTRTSTGECWPVVLTSDMQVQIQNTTPVRYLIKVTAEEVDVPSVW
jgi:hypothetical protein